MEIKYTTKSRIFESNIKIERKMELGSILSLNSSSILKFLSMTLGGNGLSFSLFNIYW